MDQIRQSMIKAAQELRALAKSTTEPTLRQRLLEQADHLEIASQEDSQDENEIAPDRPSADSRPQALS